MYGYARPLPVYTLKAVCEGKVRALQIEDGKLPPLPLLTNQLAATFGLHANDVALEHVDCDGDLIPAETDADLEAAVQVAVDQEKEAVRIHVVRQLAGGSGASGARHRSLLQRANRLIEVTGSTIASVTVSIRYNDGHLVQVSNDTRREATLHTSDVAAPDSIMADDTSLGADQAPSQTVHTIARDAMHVPLLPVAGRHESLGDTSRATCTCRDWLTHAGSEPSKQRTLECPSLVGLSTVSPLSHHVMTVASKQSSSWPSADEFSLELLRRLPRLTRLDLCVRSDDVVPRVESEIEVGPAVTIKLPDTLLQLRLLFGVITAAGVEAAVRSLLSAPKLTSLDIVSWPVDTNVDLLPLLQLTHLTELKVVSLSSPILSVVRRMTKLRNLRVKQSNQPNDLPALCAPSHAMNQLACVELGDQMGLFAEALGSLAGLPALTQLHLSYSQNRVFEQLHLLPQVTCVNISFTAWPAGYTLPSLPVHPRVCELHLAILVRQPQVVLDSLMQSMPGLRVLTLDHVSTASVAFLARLSELHTLKLSIISPTCTHHLSQACSPHFGCEPIHNLNARVDLLASLPALTSLQLGQLGRTFMSPELIAQLFVPSKRMPRLTHFEYLAPPTQK